MAALGISISHLLPTCRGFMEMFENGALAVFNFLLNFNLSLDQYFLTVKTVTRCQNP